MIKIVFENSDFVVADKPNNMSFHSEEEAGFVVQLEAQMKIKLFPVHRLDKITSGIVLLAKSSEVANSFREMFEKREVEKYYLALSLRKPKKKQGWIKGDMKSARRGSYMLLSSMQNPAITQFISISTRPGERLFLLKPHTGKTHQIRVALKSIGAPIAGDSRYTNADEAKKEDRGYLHAFGIAFELGGEVYRFVSPPEEGVRFSSQEVQSALKTWQQPWDFFK